MTTEFLYDIIAIEVIEMIVKTSIRFFNNKPVRARWDEASTSWWYSATYIVNSIFVT